MANQHPPGYFREYKLKQRYGLTKAAYDDLASGQEGRCKICQDVPSKLYVDHDHETGVVRGLLCHNCNSLLGQAYDDVDILLAAVKYLKGEL